MIEMHYIPILLPTLRIFPLVDWGCGDLAVRVHQNAGKGAFATFSSSSYNLAASSVESISEFYSASSHIVTSQRTS